MPKSNAPVQVVVAGFENEKGAKEALSELKAAQKDDLIKVKDAAVMRRDSNSKLHIEETGDMTGTRGAVLGGVAGAVVGVIAGPVGWAALGGAAIGGLAAKLHDSDFPTQRLEQWGENLAPGQSAIVAVVEHTWVPKVEQMLAEDAKEVISMEVSDEIARNLEKGADRARN